MAKTGKLEWTLMQELISLIPTDDIDLLIGPMQGEDAAIIRLRDGFLVAHVDPITTAVEHIGYLAVHVAANDIAVRGVEPKWFMPTILLPSNISFDDVKRIFGDMKKALEEIKGVIIGGHTEISPNINRPLISMTSIGYTLLPPILTRNAKPGDYVYIVGRVGGEGTGIIAWDFEEKLLQYGVEKKTIETAKNYVYDISIVKVALSIRDFVNTMHDATEGGILQAIREIAVASKTRIKVWRDKIMIEQPVAKITSALKIDPLKLLSSGCIVATVPPANTQEFENALNQLNKQYSKIGVVEKGAGEVILISDTSVDIINRDLIDEIYKLWPLM
ncbi:MAG: AIR synthase family protein [Desulfurococcaceae archaeon]